MSQVAIPPDRTQRQQLVWMCGNPKCVERGERFRFESDDPTCPKCGCHGPPVVQLRSLVHLLVPDKNGQIKGMYGRYKLACNPKRAYLSTGKNNEAACDDIEGVNCPDCLVFGKKSHIVDPLGRRISLKDAMTTLEQE